jgi:GDP-D-mannose dehydratase
MIKKACITGVTGQTGSYLAESLLEQGLERIYQLVTWLI